jgi:hypothetical protein
MYSASIHSSPSYDKFLIVRGVPRITRVKLATLHVQRSCAYPTCALHSQRSSPGPADTPQGTGITRGVLSLELYTMGCPSHGEGLTPPHVRRSLTIPGPLYYAVVTKLSPRLSLNVFFL